MRWGLVWGLALAACGDAGASRDASVHVDAGDDAGTDGGRADPGPTAHPARPVLEPCPPGWIADARHELPPYCQPPIPTEECVGERAPFAAGCLPIGSPCPAGEWADDLPEGATVAYVRAGATGGDGSMAAPYGTIAEAVASVVAAGGGVVALAKGTYLEQAELAGDDITLHGACIAETVVSSDEPGSSRGTIWVRGTGNRIHNVRVTGRRPGITIVALPEAPRTIEIDGVLVHDVEDGAFIALGPIEATVRSFVARDIAPRSTDGMFGTGIDVELGASLLLERSVVERAAFMGMFVDQTGARAEVLDLVVIDAGGRGVAVQNGSALVMGRSAILASGEVGVYAHAGASVTLADVLVRGEPWGGAGNGILAQDGSVLDMSRVAVVGTAGVAVNVDASELRASDLVVEETRSDASDGRFGRALGLQHGATAIVERAFLRSNRNAAVASFSPGTTTRVTDLVVVGTESDGTGYYGESIAAYEGASVVAERAELSYSSYTGVIAHGTGSRIELADVTVDETREAGCAEAVACADAAGHGLVAALGGSLEATRFRVSGSALANVQIAAGGAIDLHHGVVEDAPVGVNLQVDGYDLARLMDDVLFRDHGIQLDTTSLPVPSPGVR